MVLEGAGVFDLAGVFSFFLGDSLAVSFGEDAAKEVLAGDFFATLEEDFVLALDADTTKYAIKNMITTATPTNTSIF